MSNLYQIGEFAELIGVSIQTLRNWDTAGKLKPHSTTRGGIRQYSSEQLAMYANSKNVVLKVKAFGFCYMYEDENIESLSERMDIMSGYMEEKGYDFTIKTLIIYPNTVVNLKQLGVDLKDISRLVMLNDNRDPNYNLLLDILGQFNLKIEQIPYKMVEKSLEEHTMVDLVTDVMSVVSAYPVIRKEDALELSRLLLEKAYTQGGTV